MPVEKLKLKPGWLARDIAAASEQVKRLKTPIYPRCINCQPKETPHAE